MMRNPDFLKSVQDEQIRINYEEQDTDHKNSMDILKGSCHSFWYTNF